MDRRAVALVALLALAAAAMPSLGAPPETASVRAFTLEVTAASCPYRVDGEWLCLAYNGQVPGPTLDVNVGDTVRLTLLNRLAETVWATNASPAAKARLANASVSWHVHGMALAADMDGIAAQAGTNLVESVAAPGGSFTYTARAAFAGAWHYHDHVLGFDGAEGVARGLYGGLVVRDAAEARPDATLDLHLLDRGANGGRGLQAALPAGSSFEMLVVGLENRVWTAELRAPDGALLDRAEVGPGMSDRFVVPSVEAGAYTWKAGTQTGKVIVS